MKISYPLLGGHLTALAAGMALAMTLGRPSGGASGGNADAGSGNSRDNPELTDFGARPMRSAKPERAPLTSATCRQAWDLLQHESAQDRLRIRPMLLAEWAKVDLEGAMEAALMEPDSAALLDVFGEVFDADNNRIKQCFAGERYGLKTAQLRDWWIRRMSAANPDGLLGMVAEFGTMDREKIVDLCMKGMTRDQARLWKIVDGLAAMPDNPTNRKLWASAARAISERLDSATVVERLSALEGAAGNVMITEAMAALLNRTDYAGARATYDALPADLKGDIVKAALAKPGSNVNAFLAALDEVINTPDWANLQKSLAVKLHDMGPSAQYYPSLLSWASRLPERDDTMDLYRVAVRGFVANQPEQARTWIESMPEGWKRQNSLAAYVQSALSARKDVEGAKWALPQITDPRFRREADGFFTHYEQTNGVKIR